MAANASFHIADLPSRAIERLAHGRDGSEAKHSRFDSRNAIGNQARHRRKTALFRPGTIRQHYGGSAAVQARRIPGGDGAVLPKSRLECRKLFERRVRSIVFVRLEGDRTFTSRHLDRDDLALELARGLRGGETLLRP
jgi:hypothetical protein